MGPDLMDLMRKQAQRFGADCRCETVIEVDLSKPAVPGQNHRRPQRRPASGTIRDYTSRAADRRHRRLGHAGLASKGPTWATASAPAPPATATSTAARRSRVVGGGDSAVEEATFLTQFASKVTLIHRRDALRASKIMQDRDRSRIPRSSTPGTRSSRRSPAKSRTAITCLTGVKLRSTKDESLRDLKLDGLFLAIGHVPNTAVFKGQLATTPEGYLLNRTALAWKGIEAPAGLLDPCPTTGRPRASKGSSRAATSSTPTTARRSPPPARAVPRRWIARNGSKPPTANGEYH